MITALLAIALALTALLAISLPFGGWGSGMDAAGKGMAMFFPFIFMTVRISCFAVAVAILAMRGVFAWTGLPAAAAAMPVLLVLAGLGGCRAGVVCAVDANRLTGEFVEGDIKDKAEAAAIDTGLESLRVLAELDRQKTLAGAARWRPSLWAPE